MQPNTSNLSNMPNMYSPYGNMGPETNVNPQYVQSNMAQPEALKSQIQDFCQKHHNHFVLVESTDGHVYEGIIDGTDNDHVTLLVPSGDMESDDHRQFLYGGFPYGGYGFGYPYYGFPRRFRRFSRRRFPFFGLRSFFFPFFF